MKKNLSSLNVLSALTDYSDKAISLDKHDKAINAIISEGFKDVTIRSAFTPFIQITTDKMSSNKKLVNKLLKGFTHAYKDSFDKAHTHQFVKIMEKYA